MALQSVSAEAEHAFMLGTLLSGEYQQSTGYGPAWQTREQVHNQKSSIDVIRINIVLMFPCDHTCVVLLALV